ncbi:MAG: PAS domain-containing protein, partial [Thermoanaerobaculia bacterium]
MRIDDREASPHRPHRGQQLSPDDRLPGDSDATRVEPKGPSAESLSGESSSRLGVEIARRQLAEEAWRESEERFQRLVANSEDPIFVHDRDGVLRAANLALLRLTGYELDELIGRHLDRFLAESAAPEFSAYLETIFRDGHAHGFLKIRCRSGEERILQYDSVIEHEAGPRWLGRSLTTSS